MRFTMQPGEGTWGSMDQKDNVQWPVSGEAYQAREEHCTDRDVRKGVKEDNSSSLLCCSFVWGACTG